MTPAYKLLQALLFVLWPPSLFAATQVSITLDGTITDIGAAAWIVVICIATLGSLTSLLHRLKTDTPERMVPYVVSHMLMGWFAAIISFFFLEAAAVPDLAEIPCIGIAAYMGSRLVDTVSDRVIDWFNAKFGPPADKKGGSK